MNFTPVESFIGGLLIGVSVVVLYHGCGKFAGISGIASQILARPVPGWALAFVLGLPLGGLLYTLAFGMPDIQIAASAPRLIAAGLLVGVGTRLGSGCTSGHGICGLGRFSLRSLVATLVFMAVGMLTVFVTGRVI